jgi:hypothetical protein
MKRLGQITSGTLVTCPSTFQYFTWIDIIIKNKDSKLPAVLNSPNQPRKRSSIYNISSLDFTT